MEKKNNNSQKSKNNGIPKVLSKMRLVFSNAKLPHILAELEKIGYIEDRLNGFLERLSELELLYQSKKNDYSKQYAETEKFNAKRNEIDELYRRHLAFCKILFKAETRAIASLELNVSKKSSYGVWFQKVSNFYGQLLSNEDFKEKVATINIKEEDLIAQKNALSALSTLKESQKKETGDAQRATEARDKVFQALYPEYSDLVAYAKVIFKGDQTLEQLGIVVKR